MLTTHVFTHANGIIKYALRAFRQELKSWMSCYPLSPRPGDLSFAPLLPRLLRKQNYKPLPDTNVFTFIACNPNHSINRQEKPSWLPNSPLFPLLQVTAFPTVLSLHSSTRSWKTQSIQYFFLPIYMTYLFQQILSATNPSFAHSCLHTSHRFNIS